MKGSKNTFADYLSRDALVTELPDKDKKHLVSTTLQTTSICHTTEHIQSNNTRNNIVPNTIKTNIPSILFLHGNPSLYPYKALP